MAEPTSLLLKHKLGKAVNTTCFPCTLMSDEGKHVAPTLSGITSIDSHLQAVAMVYEPLPTSRMANSSERQTRTRVRADVVVDMLTESS
eukprot:m.222058 g.222058  ORF g.222058 m.222058 type:complete len:89 (-) comp33360_c0_seq3:57-323(-)